MDDLDRWNTLPTRLPDWFRDAPLGIFIHWGPTRCPPGRSSAPSSAPQMTARTA
ncbi:alpha-L-fucosidase [Brachybacterium sp. Z12]|uniref:alpha-L-fucosidase n=1 Tax=Brachybacterium sp. Z12 TaxID=2759167 RepID=UPI00223A77EA|nr:alpha-L-fucosidase [Brachybacterium sp. Z12]